VAHVLPGRPAAAEARDRDGAAAAVVGTWNNFFLPLAVLTDPQLLPVTVGLNRWTALSNAGAGGEQVWNLITSGAFISVLPLILSFLFLQRYWQGGLAIGSVK
jgi:multiple sugar transport system permease protein